MKTPVKITLPNGVTFEPDKVHEQGLSDKAKALLKKLDEQVFVIENVSQRDPDEWHSTYDKFYMTLLNSLHLGFRFKEFRFHPVYFKFTNDPKEEVKTLGFRTFVGNLPFWYPMVCFKDYVPDEMWGLTDEHVITQRMCLQMGDKFIERYINNFYAIPFGPHIDVHRLSRAIGGMMYKLQLFAYHFEKHICLSISIDDFMDLAKRFPRYDELLHAKLDTNMQPAEIEAEMKSMREEQYKIIREDEADNMLKYIILGAKGDQLQEMQNVIGLKADYEGNIIPYPINTNFIVNGLEDITHLYINDTAGRKAAVINNEHMGTTGYAWIQVARLALSMKISKTCKDCKTSNYIPVFVPNEAAVRKMIGRRYKIGSEKEWHTVGYHNSFHLVGKTIWMRSPMTCAAEDGICWECYGEMVRYNMHLNSVGIYASMMVMNKCMQDVLSVKHSQKTVSKLIEFKNPKFYEFFQISSTDVVINMEFNEPEMYSILIRQEDIHNDAIDEDALSSMFDKKAGKRTTKKARSLDDDNEPTDDQEQALDYYTKRFYVVKNAKSKKDKEEYEFVDVDEKELYMHNDFVSRLSLGKDEIGNYLSIPMSAIDSTEFVFAVGVNNQEQTGPIKAVNKLIDTKTHDGCSTIEEMVQRMLELLLQYNIPATLLQGEIVMTNLVRDANNVLKRPNFCQIVTKKDYEILSMTTALKKSPSIDAALSSAYIKYQLVADPTTFDKTIPSDIAYSLMPFLDDKLDGVPLRDIYEGRRELFEHDPS